MTKIETLHPQGKKGVNIDKSKYDTIAQFILRNLKDGPQTYEKISDLCLKEIQPTFEGKVVWYVVTVKLDLEARGIIERVPKTSPHQIRLSNQS